MRSCIHFAKKKTSILRKCDLLYKRIVFPITKQNNKIKAWLVLCRCCGTRLNPLMMCCLECSTFGCLKHLRNAHLQEKGHLFAMSTCFGEIFCLKCDDFIYDRKIEKTRSEYQNARRKMLGLSLRHRWNPGRYEARLCRRSSLRLLRLLNSNNTGSSQQSIGATLSIPGLRGLVNLGNTCFMNNQHNCKLCSLTPNSDLNTCLMCELAHIFQEFYGGESLYSPFVPNRMLHLVWTHAKHLSGYEQHDAHEFLISALNILHRHSESLSMKQNPHDCKCIIDRLFTGQLQSDLTCTKCGRISTKLDPYWDISLELLNGKTAATTTIREETLLKEEENNNRRSESVGSNSLCSTTTNLSNLNTNNNEGKNELSLEECLLSFVRAENLGTKIKCERCGTYEISTKQLTLRKLPIVACFHLKRFEHVNTSNKRQKIIKPFRFPESIDLTPYTTPFRNTHENCKEMRQTRQKLTSLSNQYSLFAVVNHTGSTESGHYTCYVRHQRDNWFNCNDQKIRKERLEDVLSSEGYLLFYCKSFIDYD
uniref:ubiquitinyl hydrolase 1 n=1 Tax=Meloidogyne hapla TaxID=6305 RepID=A0A1I8BYM4_MELHA